MVTEALDLQDGRHARRDRNKIAVVDAFLELVRAGNPRPSVADVAERSGISHRSVFRYFADKDELARTAISRQEAAVAPMFTDTIARNTPLADRVRTLVTHRLSLFEEIAPVARLSRALAPLQPIVSAEITRSRGFLRVQVNKLFAAELDAMDPVRAASIAAVLDVVCSFESIDLLRVDQGLSQDHAAAALVESIMQLLG
ncbi:MAG: TetR/AcrR family transcriptional regulator [Actinomycetota bacterium]